MGRNSTYNILMYSHDTYGLGHIRRTMAIASHLRGPSTNILILTGSPIAGRFAFPDHVDFVRIPGMIKKTNEEYLPLSIKINSEHALNIRSSIIKATAKSFQPNLFIVDKEPLGLKKEVLPTLEWMRRNLPRARTVLGLRDIMDDAKTVRNDWTRKGIYEVLDSLYSEVWIYGLQHFYDSIREYAIPESVARHSCFTGYIPRKITDQDASRKMKKTYAFKNGEKLVVVTTGGGGDGYPVMDAYLTMLERASGKVSFQSVLITGPFMPEQERKMVFERARRLGVISCRFFRKMEEILAAADLVVTMGGYNTLCEILAQKTLALVIPRDTPRKEQLIRARVFKQHQLADYIPWNALSPEALGRQIIEMLESPGPRLEAISRFRLTGLDTMKKRIERFKTFHNGQNSKTGSGDDPQRISENFRNVHLQ
ncbi:MAG: glycosyltransferase [Desulfobacterales bacterium]|nr:glycosyltransferase [Desulfobacterales bacterium]MDD4072984.1 glycosyltransferase [Desulfobacterales bacterium]MDD4392864.1 glycosyltransferase [Desulfobacterales bacterium]